MYLAFLHINYWSLIIFLKGKFVSHWCLAINWQDWLKTHPGGELLSSVWPDPINWLGWLKTHPACKSLSSAWPDPINWWDWLNIHPECELLFVLDHIPSTDKVGWTPIQKVSSSPVWSYQLTRLAEHPSRMWVALHCLMWSIQLTRLAEHPSSGWVAF